MGTREVRWEGIVKKQRGGQWTWTRNPQNTDKGVVEGEKNSKKEQVTKSLKRKSLGRVEWTAEVLKTGTE